MVMDINVALMVMDINVALVLSVQYQERLSIACKESFLGVT